MLASRGSRFWTSNSVQIMGCEILEGCVEVRGSSVFSKIEYNKFQYLRHLSTVLQQYGSGVSQTSILSQVHFFGFSASQNISGRLYC
jgi:hypothetical protein